MQTSTVNGKREMVKVSAQSRSTAVAGAIAGMIRQYRECKVQAIGAGACNQALKAVAIARSYLEQDHLDIAIIPHFADVEINGEERTAIRMHIEARDTEFAPKVPRTTFALARDEV